MTVKKNKSGIYLICVLAFAAVALFVFFKGKSNGGSGSEGLRNFRAESFQDSTGWAYRIYEKNVAVIEQKSVPGIAGSAGFKTKDEASRTGELVIAKLNAGVFPPTVSRHELDSMKINY